MVKRSRRPRNEGFRPAPDLLRRSRPFSGLASDPAILAGAALGCPSSGRGGSDACRGAQKFGAAKAGEKVVNNAGG